MNFSQKHFLLFTFLKCNVVYLCSWTARIKAFIPEDQVWAEIEEREKRERDRDERGAEEEEFKAREVKLEGQSLSAFLQPARIRNQQLTF